MPNSALICDNSNISVYPSPRFSTIRTNEIRVLSSQINALVCKGLKHKALLTMKLTHKHKPHRGQQSSDLTVFRVQFFHYKASIIAIKQIADAGPEATSD